MILGGLVGNVLVCLSVATSSNLKSLVNMLLVNLAISDIIVLMACAPFSILQVRDINYFCVQYINDVYYGKIFTLGCDKHLALRNNALQVCCIHPGSQ